MTTTSDQTIFTLVHNDQAIDDYGAAVAAACQDLARVANGCRCAVIPAPTAWTLLSHVRVGLRHLEEVLDYLPGGLKRSLSDPTIVVTDADDRDPVKSIDLAVDALEPALNQVGDVLTRLEAAQAAIGAQSWHPTYEF